MSYEWATKYEIAHGWGVGVYCGDMWENGPYYKDTALLLEPSKRDIKAQRTFGPHIDLY